jgi:DNA-binding NtrC family response regulator
MDLTIPDGIGGEEAIKKILEIDKNVKVIVSTGYSNSLVVSEYKKYGFVGSMSKPFTINELDEVINKALSN